MTKKTYIKISCFKEPFEIVYCGTAYHHLSDGFSAIFTAKPVNNSQYITVNEAERIAEENIVYALIKTVHNDRGLPTIQHWYQYNLKSGEFITSGQPSYYNYIIYLHRIIIFYLTQTAVVAHSYIHYLF